MEAGALDNKTSYYRVHPLKFTMWLFLVVVLMLFAAFTSAYIVNRARAEGNWTEIQLPDVFQLSVVLVIISSVFMQLAYQAAKKNRLTQLRLFLWLTFLPGIGFLISQASGWAAMVERGDYFVGRVSYSFVYVISFMHAVHVLGGIIALASNIFSAHRFKIHSGSLLKINLCATFWHFMGGLWIYLFIFLSLLR